MREFVFDVAIRPAAQADGRWEAFAPALPGFLVTGDGDIQAFDAFKASIIAHLATRLETGQGIPEQGFVGRYLSDYGLIFWQFLRIRLGPRRTGQAAVEPIFPDIDELLLHFGDVALDD